MHSDRGPSIVEASPYIEAFRGRLIVVKLGGELLDGGPVLERILPQVAVLYRCGLRPLLVHGGGKQVDDACRDRGIEPEKHRGRRVTTPEVLDVMMEVVAGTLNRSIVDRLRRDGIGAIGYADGVCSNVSCTRRAPTSEGGVTVDWGYVGDVVAVDRALLDAADTPDGWQIPVLPSLGTTPDGVVNVNADAVASRVAIDLDAEKLVLLTGVSGVMESEESAGPLSELTEAEVRELIEDGTVRGGMRAKLEEALRALREGVSQVHIISGREPSTLLREIFTDEGCGTLVIPGAGAE